MRQGINMTPGYQIRYMLLVQLMASGITFLLSMMFFAWFLDKDIIKELASVVTILINGGMIYSHAHRFAVIDNRSYTPLEPNVKKSVLMGVIITVTTLLLFIGYELVWHIWGSEGSLSNWGAIIYNVIFTIWTFPYMGIMGASHGLVTWYSVVLFIIVPPIFSVLGYIAGCKKFSLLEKFHALTYEKKK